MPASSTSTTSTTTPDADSSPDPTGRSTTTTSTTTRSRAKPKADKHPTTTTPRTTSTVKVPRTTTTTTTPRVTTRTPAVDQPAASSGPAPIGGSRKATWWTPAPDQFSTAMVWFFDPSGEQRPYGWQQTFPPAGVVSPVMHQHNFTYATAGTRSAQLLYPTGTRQVLEVVSYDEQADVARVVWEGTAQTWYGCRSGKMPAAALAACRA